MCSEHVLLMVPRRCGTNVLGLWDCGGALLGSVEEQRSLHFQSTVRRSAPCTMSCWPQSCEHLPCSSTHPITPDPTLCISGGTLKKRTAKISHCRLYFARRWDLKRQILSFLGPTPPPCFRYGPPQSVSRPGWCCPVVGPTSRMCCMAGCGWFATVCASIVASSLHPT